MNHKLILSAALVAIPLSAAAQTSRNEKPKVPSDPFATEKARAAAAATEDPAARFVNLTVTYEVFSLPLTDAAALMRRGLSDDKFYDELLALVSAETARQEALSVSRLSSGQRFSNVAATEHIYPTEYEPAELPNQVGVLMSRAGKDDPRPAPDVEALKDAPDRASLDALVTPATGTAFETRNIGISIEADARFDSKTGLIELLIRPEHASLVGRTQFGQGVSTLTMPEIESQSLSTSVFVKPDVPHLLGTMNRPPVSKVKADSANEIWFAFVTITPVEP